MLFRVEAQMPLRVAMAQRTGGDHLGVEQGITAEQAVEIAAVAIGPVHHGGYRGAPQRGVGKSHDAIIPATPLFKLGTMVMRLKIFSSRCE